MAERADATGEQVTHARSTGSLITHRVAGDGATVVLVHAGAADSRMWDETRDALVADHTVVTFDMRGFGDSPLVPGHDDDVADVLALLDHLQLGPLALVGASYGGGVALRVAAAVPDQVTRLILLASIAEGLEPGPDVRAFGAQEDELIEAGDLDGATQLNAATWLGPDADDRARERMLVMQRHAFELQQAATDGDHEPGRGDQDEDELDLSRITARTTVIVGGHDLQHFRNAGHYLVEHLPDAELMELPWAGHLPSLERPQETAELVRRLINDETV